MKRRKKPAEQSFAFFSGWRFQRFFGGNLERIGRFINSEVWFGLANPRPAQITSGLCEVFEEKLLQDF